MVFEVLHIYVSDFELRVAKAYENVQQRGQYFVRSRWSRVPDHTTD